MGIFTILIALASAFVGYRVGYKKAEDKFAPKKGGFGTQERKVEDDRNDNRIEDVETGDSDPNIDA